MLRRRDNGKKLHGLVTTVDEVMHRPGRDANGTVWIELACPIGKVDLARSLHNVDESITLGRLLANILTGSQRHHDQLAVLSGEQHLPKVLVVLGYVLEVNS